MDRFKFTQAFLNKTLKPLEGKTLEVGDEDIKQLQCRVRPGGHKSLSVYMRPKGYPRSVRVTLEEAVREKMSIPAMRAEADELVRQMRKGINPIKAREEAKAAEKRAEEQAKADSLTLQDALDMYTGKRRIAAEGKARKRKQIKASTAEGYSKTIEKHLADWLPMQLSDITPKMVVDRHDKIADKTPVAANNVMRIFRGVYNHAEKRHRNADGISILPPNPASIMEDHWVIEKRRSNTIDEAELKDWWASTEKIAGTRIGTRKKEVPVYAHGDGELARDYLQFVILTGLRRREASGLLWENVNLRSKKITLLDTKNKDNLELPLSDYLLDILERRQRKDSVYVFPIKEVKKFVNWIREDSGVVFTVHDLRRTFITYAAGEKLNIGVYTIKALVNHRIATNDVTGGYARIKTEGLRKPMQKITDYVLGHAGVRADNVVEIGRAKAK